jgi:hypothetical protein
VEAKGLVSPDFRVPHNFSEFAQKAST